MTFGRLGASACIAIASLASLAALDARADQGAASSSPIVAPVKRVAPRMPANTSKVSTSESAPKKPTVRRAGATR